MRRAIYFLSALYLAVGLSGCGSVTEADRMLARELMAQSGSNCIHIEGGSVMGMLPMAGGVAGGGYRGSLSAAHSEGDKPVECTPLRSGALGAQKE